MAAVHLALARWRAHREDSPFRSSRRAGTVATVERASRSPAGESPAPRLVEVVAAFSLASDLGLGQPMEHGLRSCLIATGLAERLGLDQDECGCVYWVTLLAMVGCTGASYEMALLFGDDIELRHGVFDVGPSQFAMPRYFVGRAGADGGPVQRVRTGASLVLSGMRAVMDGFAADCRAHGPLRGAPGVRRDGQRGATAEVRAMGWQGRPRRAGRGADRATCADPRALVAAGA